MKKVVYRIFLVIQLVLMPVFLSGVFADEPGPPGPGGDPTGGGGGVPVGAPIDSGVIVLIVLGVFYGCYKLYGIWKKSTTVHDGEAA